MTSKSVRDCREGELAPVSSSKLVSGGSSGDAKSIIVLYWPCWRRIASFSISFVIVGVQCLYCSIVKLKG